MASLRGSKRPRSEDSESRAAKKLSPSVGEDECVAILDAGAQYGKIIDRRVRELSVRTSLLPLDTPAAQLSEYCALIISGGPNSVNNSDAPSYDPDLFSLGLPVLGICYGMQLINTHYGGSVGVCGVREDGQFPVTINTECDLFSGLQSSEMVLLTHGDSVLQLASCLTPIAQSGSIVAGVKHNQLPIFGVQFHPEADLTVSGQAMFKNFLYNVARCTGTCTVENREAKCLEYIRSKVGSSAVLSLVSGGVDSTVCTALLHAALGPDRVYAVHIDNGFLRSQESLKVKSSLEKFGIRPIVIKASARFLSAQTNITYSGQDGVLSQHLSPPLHSVTNPEEKRKIIGDTFIKVADGVVQELHLNPNSIFLAQGTLRPDLIESASSLVSTKAQVIKTHHNDTPLVRELRELGRVVEPLAEFHKDEVRQLGKCLGLPKELVSRHPFPGPGLAIRVLCQKEPHIREDFAPTNALLHSLMNSEFSSEVTSRLSEEEQQFLLGLTQGHSLHATLLPIYSVGVQGDCRSYNYVAALSCEGEMPEWPLLLSLAKLIPKICHVVNRVVWVFGDPVRGPVENVTPTYLRSTALATLRQADLVAYDVLVRHGAVECISQMPVVLIPIHFDRPENTPSCQRSVVIRTFITSDFMTGIPATPGDHLPLTVLREMVTSLQTVSGVSRVLYDLTPKPPGTTEWE